MNFVVGICRKICGYDALKKEIKKLETEVKNRDIILKRIKIVSTSNHYGYSKEDMEYREKNCINEKLRKIFELATEFDKSDKLDFWDDLGELEEVEE